MFPTGTVQFKNGGQNVGLPIRFVIGSLTPGFPTPTIGSTGAQQASLATVIGDFNNDGKPDLAATNFSDNTVSILFGKGDGTFAPAKTYPTGDYPYGIAVGDTPLALTVGDFDANGTPDIAVVNSGSKGPAGLTILLNPNTASFVKQNVATGSGPVSVTILDFDSRKVPELAVVNNTDGTLTIFPNNGPAKPFTAATSVVLPTIGGPYQVLAADLNGDGEQDLTTISYGSTALAIQLGTQTGVVSSLLTAGTVANPTSTYLSGSLDAYAGSISTAP